MTGLSWTAPGGRGRRGPGPDGRALARYSWLRRQPPLLRRAAPARPRRRAHHARPARPPLAPRPVVVVEVPRTTSSSGRTTPTTAATGSASAASVVTHHDVSEDAGAVVAQRTAGLARRHRPTSCCLIEAAHDPARPRPVGVDGAWGPGLGPALDRARCPSALEATPWPETAWGGYGGLNYRPRPGDGDRGEGRRPRGRGGRRSCTGCARRWAALHGSGRRCGERHPRPSRPRRRRPSSSTPRTRATPRPLYAFSAATGFGFLATAPLMRESFALEAVGEPPPAGTASWSLGGPSGHGCSTAASRLLRGRAPRRPAALSDRAHNRPTDSVRPHCPFPPNPLERHRQ